MKNRTIYGKTEYKDLGRLTEMRKVSLDKLLMFVEAQVR